MTSTQAELAIEVLGHKAATEYKAASEQFYELLDRRCKLWDRGMDLSNVERSRFYQLLSRIEYLESLVA